MRAHPRTREWGAGLLQALFQKHFLIPPSLLRGHPAGVGVAFVSDLPKGFRWGEPLLLPLTASVRPLLAKMSVPGPLRQLDGLTGSVVVSERIH